MHVLCGIPGSGKTTLSKQMALGHNAALYCYDTFPGAYRNKDARKIMYSSMAKDLTDGKTVICDDLNTTKADRLALLDALSGVDCKKTLHVMTTPPKVCWERLEKRSKQRIPESLVLHLNARFEHPSLDEGWDEITYH